MKHITLFITLLSLVSCTSNNGQISADTSYSITISNNSGHDIDMRLIGEIIIIGSIKNNDDMPFYFIFPSNGTGSVVQELPPPPDFQEADSIRITYSNKATIFHTKAEKQLVSKSLLLQSSYVGGKTTSNEYEYTYTFTPEDFEEAVLYGD